MFEKLLRMLKTLKLKRANESGKEQGAKRIEEISPSIQGVRKRLEEIFHRSDDLMFREFSLGEDSSIKVTAVYIDGLVDRTLLDNGILNSLMVLARSAGLDKPLNRKNVLNILKENLLANSDVSEIEDFRETVDLILTGDTIIYIDGIRTALKVGTRGGEKRAVEEPDTESVVRGPREGFVENLRTNTALIRRKIKDPGLKMEMMILGRRTRTEVMICYIQGLAHEDIVKTVRRRLKRIKIDAVLESGYLEEFIEDTPYSLFPTVGNTEKPDIAAARILEGRVAILCDGTPFVLTVPYLFLEALQASEDYYSSYLYSSLNRLLRILSLIITLTLPALYVALVSFHQDVIPLKLLLTIAATREGIPFSAFNETLLMGITFEILREAGVRMPRPIGQAVSIVGALVLGQAAVEAGIASNPVVMVTAITAIASFTLPALRGTLPIIRILLIITANIIGLYGIFLLFIVFFIHMAKIRTFGVPYLSPFSPVMGMDLKDTFLRLPLWLMWTRPGAVIRKRYNNRGKDLEYRMKADIRTKED